MYNVVETETPEMIYKSKARSFSVTLDLLHHHIFRDDSTLHPEQIKFLVTKMIQNIIEFEGQAMDKWNSLSEEDKQELNDWYEAKLYWRNSDFHGRPMDPSLFDRFYTEQERQAQAARAAAEHYSN